MINKTSTIRIDKLGITSLYNFFEKNNFCYESVRNFSASHNYITNIIDINNISNLSNINVSSNQITSVDCLRENKQLTHVNISNNEIVNINDLLLSPNKIRNLYCYNNLLTSINLTKCFKLEVLDVSDNNIEELDITSLKKLKILIANKCCIKKIRIDDTYRMLETVSLKFNRLTTFNIKNNNISKLDISNNFIEGMIFIECPRLIKLDASFNKITNIVLLSNTITNLNLSHNKFTSIPYIESLEILNLDLSNNFIMDIDTSFYFTGSLKNLNLSSNNITNIDNIITFTSLEYLDIENNNIRNINILNEHNKLKTLKIKGNTYMEPPSYKIINSIKLEGYISKSIEKNNLSLLETRIFFHDTKYTFIESDGPDSEITLRKINSLLSCSIKNNIEYNINHLLYYIQYQDHNLYLYLKGILGITLIYRPYQIRPIEYIEFIWDQLNKISTCNEYELDIFEDYKNKKLKIFFECLRIEKKHFKDYYDNFVCLYK